MLVGYAGLQAADAHSTLRALDAGAVEANPSPVAQWGRPVRAAGLRGQGGRDGVDRLGAAPHGLSAASPVVLDGHRAEHATRGGRVQQLQGRFKDAGGALTGYTNAAFAGGHGRHGGRLGGERSSWVPAAPCPVDDLAQDGVQVKAGTDAQHGRTQPGQTVPEHLVLLPRSIGILQDRPPLAGRGRCFA